MKIKTTKDNLIVTANATVVKYPTSVYKKVKTCFGFSVVPKEQSPKAKP